MYERQLLQRFEVGTFAYGKCRGENPNVPTEGQDRWVYRRIRMLKLIPDTWPSVLVHAEGGSFIFRINPQLLFW